MTLAGQQGGPSAALPQPRVVMDKEAIVSFWVIEIDKVNDEQNWPRVPTYVALNGGPFPQAFHYSTDWKDAVRFSRCRDAEVVIAMMKYHDYPAADRYVASEHRADVAVSD